VGLDLVCAERDCVGLDEGLEVGGSVTVADANLDDRGVGRGRPLEVDPEKPGLWNPPPVDLLSIARCDTTRGRAGAPS
jgi:hypothetical protein